jgi:hypothetical protein
MVTDAQVRKLRRALMEGKPQSVAAAAAGMSERSGRKWKDGLMPSETKQPRSYRTRKDPFETVWTSDILPLLEGEGGSELEAKTILEELDRRYPGQFGERSLRTLQRRMRLWRAVAGPEREVVFPQEHVPGREAAMDFTHATELGVTVGGQLLVHLLFVLKLSYSGWTWVQVAFGETFEALVSGLQSALWSLGGVPAVVRHDNLSAATHELRLSGGRDLTMRFRRVMEHYGLISTRIEPGEAHQNGVAEKANDLVKSWLEQALIVRGSRNFTTVSEYEAFARAVVADKSGRRGDRIAEERARLRPLPTTRVPEYTTVTATVRTWSTIRVIGRTYSVPSKLIGHDVEARVYPDHVEVYFAQRLVERMERLRGERDVRIDYRHVIWSLVRKPGAFARYRYREELFPSTTFRRAYDALRNWRGERADVEYVRILHLAASTMEAHVERSLSQLLDSRTSFDYATVKKLLEPEDHVVPEVVIGEPNLHSYDELLEGRCA